jgi:thiamine-phosphate pyrophosphorylase
MRKSLRLGLYVITDARPDLGRGHLEVAEAALEAGADAVQLRAKDVGGREMYELAVGLKELLGRRGSGTLFLVNDRVDVALVAEADGVHLGWDDLPPARARLLLGEEKVLGVSASSTAEALAALEAGADYLGAGPVYPTGTKADAGEPIGLEGLREITGRVDIPVVAIGGITVDRVREVLEAGASGVAVISAVIGADDMYEAVLRLRREVDRYLGR